MNTINLFVKKIFILLQISLFFQIPFMRYPITTLQNRPFIFYGKQQQSQNFLA